MTLEEAIIQFKEDAEYNRADLDLSWAEENEQVAKWLEELKDYRDKNKMVVKVDVMNIQELKDKIPEAYEQGRAEAEEDAENRMSRILDDEKRLSYEQGRKDAIDECIALARAEIDFESQSERKRFVEFMEQLKEKKNG